MLETIKKLFTPHELLKGNYGIEREALRVTSEGILSNKPHPDVFGDKVHNQYITTDFSESQVEVITPVLNTVEDVYNFTNALYNIVAMEIEEEYLWPQSMPCAIQDEKLIPLAIYSEEEKEARKYREKLLDKYGGKKQLISGIHYNFSFNEIIIQRLYENENTNISYKEFKNNIYLKVARNYLRYRWIIIYLLGGTTTLHESYLDECCKKHLKEIAVASFSNDGAVSYRNGECGYKNNVDLFPNYNSVESYINSISTFINDGIIESHKELYSQIRLKPKSTKNFSKSLLEDGISYLEYRSIDINPFEKGGISLEDLRFFEIFNIFLLIYDESDYENWQEEAQENQHIIAKLGQNDIMLKKDGKFISKEKWALDILKYIKTISNELNLNRDGVINSIINKIKDNKLTYAYRISEKVKKEGYIQAHLNLAKQYKKQAYMNRFKFDGYDDLELSTQILIKESIKRGITIEILDRSDNFISLKNKDKFEYVKQATKTSKDSYISVLIMENKTVTKKVLANNNIEVPDGKEFYSIEQVKDSIKDLVNKPIVIKPKSTNFGLGISIFQNGANEVDIIKAFDIAFKCDTTVIMEEFVKGKEYRFLVIDKEVVGILHRVPANVKGDGIKSIRQLINIKNNDPLRGVGYVKPLEKIKLDESAELFLSNQNKDFDYIPLENEIVFLRENSNISTGGDSIDYTDVIPDRFKNIAIECAKTVGARICGVDMMLEDFKDEESNYSIIELNFNPAIHIHCYPYIGKERNIAVKVLELLDII